MLRVDSSRVGFSYFYIKYHVKLKLNLRANPTFPHQLLYNVTNITFSTCLSTLIPLLTLKNLPNPRLRLAYSLSCFE